MIRRAMWLYNVGYLECAMVQFARQITWGSNGYFWQVGAGPGMSPAPVESKLHYRLQLVQRV